MNIAVDSGNTIAKVGIFTDDLLEETLFFHDSTGLKEFLQKTPAQNIIVSSVSTSPAEMLLWSIAKGKKISLTADLPLPVKILYKTPSTLGVDRIAAVCGAMDLFPHKNCLVIDAGTCVNFELLDSLGNYHGGAISPGIKMRFEAMHHFTARLPLVQATAISDLIGTSTETCMQSGVINGIKAEITGIIQKYKEGFNDLHILICGGDAQYFENADDGSIFVVPDLVLRGLNLILRHGLQH